MRDEFRASHAASATGNVLGQCFYFPGEAGDVRHPDRVVEPGEHRRIVRRISGKSEILFQHSGTAYENFREELLRHRELVIAAEPTVDMDRADFRAKARSA